MKSPFGVNTLGISRVLMSEESTWIVRLAVSEHPIRLFFARSVAMYVPAEKRFLSISGVIRSLARALMKSSVSFSPDRTARGSLRMVQKRESAFLALSPSFRKSGASCVRVFPAGCHGAAGESGLSIYWTFISAITLMGSSSGEEAESTRP